MKVKGSRKVEESRKKVTVCLFGSKCDAYKFKAYFNITRILVLTCLRRQLKTDIKLSFPRLDDPQPLVWLLSYPASNKRTAVMVSPSMINSKLCSHIGQELLNVSSFILF